MFDSPSFPPSLALKIVPNAKRREIVGYMADGTLKVRLISPPHDGRANEELLLLFFEVTGVPWEIVSGYMSSRKVLRRKD
jgi:uncharacterized protein (TIGR00251 family)